MSVKKAGIDWFPILSALHSGLKPMQAAGFTPRQCGPQHPNHRPLRVPGRSSVRALQLVRKKMQRLQWNLSDRRKPSVVSQAPGQHLGGANPTHLRTNGMALQVKGLNEKRYRCQTIGVDALQDAVRPGCGGHRSISPVHTTEAFVKMGADLKNIGADSIAIKDMAGLITPYVAYDLVKALKEQVGLPVELHTHYTSGFGTASLLKAVEAGVDVVDCAISAMAMSTSQPPTETLVAALKGTERDSCLDLAKLADIARKVTEVRKKYVSFEAGIAPVDVNVLQFQVPGSV